MLGLFTFAAVTPGIGGAPAAPIVTLEPGRYTVTITYEVQNQRQNEPRIAIRCITAEDLGDPEMIFSGQAASPQTKGQECAVKKFRSTNRMLSYEAECPNRTVHVEGALSADGFSVVRSVTPKGNEKVQLKFAVRGRRTGDCSTR